MLGEMVTQFGAQVVGVLVGGAIVWGGLRERVSQNTRALAEEQAARIKAVGDEKIERKEAIQAVMGHCATMRSECIGRTEKALTKMEEGLKEDIAQLRMDVKNGGAKDWLVKMTVQETVKEIMKEQAISRGVL